MQLQDVVTGSKVSAWFEVPPEPADGEPVLLIEGETGTAVCSKAGARRFRLLQYREQERERAHELGYHFAP